MSLGRGFAVAVAAALLAVGGVEPALATTFCVPGFHAACPNDGVNVAEGDVEKAMSLQGADGKADQVVIAAGTFTEGAAFEPAGGDAETYEPTGTDPLTIAGAGPGATVLTGSGTNNSYLFNFNFNNDRAIIMRDLTVRIPASFPDGGGAGFQLDGDTLDNVDIESRNPGSDGIWVLRGSTFRDGRVFGAAGGSIDAGFTTNDGGGPGVMLIERSTIEDTSWGIHANSGSLITRAIRIEIVDPLAYGVRVDTGGIATLRNTVIVVDDGLAVSAVTGDTGVVIFTMQNSTIVDTGGGSGPVIEVGDGLTPQSGSLNAVFNSVIVAGNQQPVACDSPMSSTLLTFQYSYLFTAGVQKAGKCTVSTTNSLDAAGPAGAPQFLAPGDFRLTAGSPAIDSGDPATATLPTDDFDGSPRPVDGDGDGVARRDIGAYEYQPPAPPEPPGKGGVGGEVPGDNAPPASDTTPPATRILAGPGGRLGRGVAVFRLRSSETGSSFRCKLDRRKLARCKSPKRYAKLKPGRHVFRVWAVDAAGNKDPTPAKRRFRVPSR